MKILKNLFGKRKAQPLISILVPCYNSRKTLPSTLKSIQQSKYKNLDVMIVDDGHEIKVKDIVEGFNDKRFRYFDKQNEGLGLTRNFGIRNALGEYIFFLDSDDLIYPDTFIHLMDYMLENDLEVVSGVTVRKDFETKKESEWFRHLYKKKKIVPFSNRLTQFDDTLSTNKLYKIETLKKHNIFFETGLYEDKLFTAKLYSKVEKIGVIDERVYVWLIYGEATSITTTKTLANFKGRMVAINNLWQYLPELRKAYQIAFYMNHDLLIYLREFEFYSAEEKDEIYEMAYEFIQKNKHYVYKRLISNSWNMACLDALCEGNKEKFMYTADCLSKVFQCSQKDK